MEKEFFSISANECLTKLKTSANGLSEDESRKRLNEFGENKLPEVKKKSLIVMFFKQFCDVMLIILLCASFTSILIAIVNNSSGELLDGFIILGIVLLNAIIGFLQERKAEKSMNELKKLTEPQAKVLHNGKIAIVPSKYIVIGDIIELEAGDIVPADCRLIDDKSLKCDESSLTGESEPVLKSSKIIIASGTPLAERKNMVYSGTIVTSGHGLAVITATATNAEIGKIASLLSSAEKTITPLQHGIHQLAKITTYLVLAICLITFIIELIATPEEPMEAFLTAIAIAVAAIPESLPAVITIIMSLGVAKLARKKAIVKHLHAIETIGSCEIICTDKTGTLTQNKMQVQKVFCNGFIDNFSNNDSPEFEKMLNVMALCESVEEMENGLFGDPTEIALVEFAKTCGISRTVVQKKLPIIDEIPFDSNRKLMSVIIQNSSGLTALTKGAVDELLKISSYIEINGKVEPLTPFHKQKILRANKEMASDALRVLGFAYKNLESTDEKIEEKLVFVGLSGMLDPPRRETFRAVKKCKSAGIIPIMITGDHKNTAFAIARKIGITDKPNEVITGAEIDLLNDENFEKIIFSKKVFARVSPENKVRIVTTFKRLHKVVAMTGDGINDAPSIKNASIGIGMGQTGTDVTKEACDVIITDDNFATIILAVEEGRKIYSNIQKTVQFLFSANLAELTAIFLACILLPEAVFLTPVQILFVNLITDTLPAIALGLEPAEKNLMNIPPRKQKNSLLSGGVGFNILFLGLIQGIVMLTCYFWGHFALKSPEIATTMAFYALNIVQFFYFISMRADNIWRNPISNNKFACLAVFACFAFVILVAISPLKNLLGLCSLPFSCWLVIIIACIITFCLSEIFKKRNTE